MSQVVSQRWRFARRLEVGGQSEVWLVWDAQDRRWVVGKRRPANHKASVGDLLVRFGREVEHARAVRAAGGQVLEVLDAEVERDEDRAYIIWTLARHGSVADRLSAARLQRVPFPRELTYDVLFVLGDTLAIADGLGILHRDIKPANIMLDEHDCPYLGDWGIARANSDSSITVGCIGAVGYMAPEVLAREAEASIRSEVFSAAVVAYELLTGVRPFEDIKRGETPVPPSARERSLPSVVDSIVLRGLADDPMDRWPSVKAMTDRLLLELLDWASTDPRPEVGVKLAAAAEVLKADEMEAVSNVPERTRRMGPRHRRRVEQPVDGVDEARPTTQLYYSIAAVIGSLTFTLLVVYLWVPVTDAFSAIASAVEMAVSGGERLIGLIGRDGEWGVVVVGLAVGGGMGTLHWMRTRVRLTGASLVTGSLIIAVLFSLAFPPGPAREHYGVAHQRSELVSGMRAEARRWAAHYQRFPNDAARQATARSIRQAVFVTRQARANLRGYARLRHSESRLSQWRRDRKTMAAAGNW